jgi:ribosome-associated protein
LESDQKVEIIQTAMDELKGLDIKVLSVREKTQMTDYMVICSGTSNIHIRAIADKIIERMKEHDIKGVRREGYGEARWVLMDFGDVEEFWEKDKPLVTA